MKRLFFITIGLVVCTTIYAMKTQTPTTVSYLELLRLKVAQPKISPRTNYEDAVDKYDRCEYRKKNRKDSPLACRKPDKECTLAKASLCPGKSTQDK